MTIPITKAEMGGATTTDYSGVPDVVTFGATETEKRFVFVATDDTDDDDGESVELGFGDLPGGLQPGTIATTSVAIADDDAPESVEVSFESDTYTVDEGSAISIQVILSEDPEREVVIPITRAERGGATSTDYSGVPDSVTFESGDTEQSFTLTAIDDDVDDDGESVRLTFGELPDRVIRGSVSTTTVTITDDDTAGVTISETELTIEEGGSDTYTVVLDSEPTATTTVTVTDPSNTDVTADPESLTFTTESWDTEQTVTVSAGQDEDSTEDTATVTHTVASADSDYQGAAASDVRVTVTDADDPAVSVRFGQGTYSATEGGDVEVSVILSEDPEREVVVPLTRTNQHQASDADYSGVPDSVTFESGDTEQSFTLTAIDDDVDDDGESVRLTFGELPDRVIRGSVSTTTVTITDDDTAGVTISETELTIEEGGSDTYTVVLDSEPTATTTVTVTDPSNTDVTADPESLTFTTESWDTEQTVTVSAGQDEDSTEDTATVTHTVASADSDYQGAAASDVRVTVTDADDPAVSVRFGQGTYSATEGGDVEVSVILSEDPEREVVVPLTRTNQHQASDADYSGVPDSVTFESGDTEQSFTLTAIDDDVDDDGESVRLTFGELPDRVIRGSVSTTTVTITDDDTAGVTISETELTIEEGGSDTYTVVLDSEPTATTTVTVTDPSNTDVTADPESLTFTTESWDTEQTVTVSAGQDEDSTEDTATVTHTVASADSDYQGAAASDVRVTVTDADDPAVSVRFGQGTY